jgi:hypothetical protein
MREKLAKLLEECQEEEKSTKKRPEIVKKNGKA